MTHPETRARKSSGALALWLLLFCAAQNLYLFGAAAILHVVTYPALADVPSTLLPAFHASLSRRLAIVFILPEFLAFLSVLPLFWVRSLRISAWTVWTCVALGVAYFAVTFGWHLPMHKLLAHGDASASTMQLLLGSHAIRTASVALKCGLLVWMLAATLRRAEGTASSDS